MLMDCGCDNRRDIMFTRGNGHAPIVALLVIGALIIYWRS